MAMGLGVGSWAKNDWSVRQAMLGQLAVGREDGNLGDAFVKVHADMYHRLGLLFSELLPGSLSSQPISGWAGGQRTYGITTPSTARVNGKWTRTPRGPHPPPGVSRPRGRAGRPDRDAARRPGAGRADRLIRTT
jgi:hypothetical protein